MLVTVTDVFTKYVVPTSLLSTVAFETSRIVPEVRVTIGAVASAHLA